MGDKIQKNTKDDQSSFNITRTFTVTYNELFTRKF